MSYATSAPALPKSAAPPSINNHFKAAIAVPFLPSPGNAPGERSPPSPPQRLGRGSPPADSVTRRARLAFAPTPVGRRAAVPLHPIQRVAEYARASCAVPRANSVRAGILRAVAGRIIKNAACSVNQSSPAAVATANIVAMASVANSSVAFIVRLPTSTPTESHAHNQSHFVDKKGLTEVEASDCLWAEIYGVSLRTHHILGNTPGMPPSGSEAGSGRWPTRRSYVELLTLFFLARSIRSARGPLRFLRFGICSPPLSPHFRHPKDIQLIIHKTYQASLERRRPHGAHHPDIEVTLEQL